MADAVVSMVLENAQKLIQNEFALQLGVKDDVKKLSRTLRFTKFYLRDAEEKEMKEEAVRLWLRELKDAAYEVDDILDKYRTKVSQLEDKRGPMNKVCGAISKLNPKDVAFRRSFAKKMKKAQVELDEIRKMGLEFGLQTRNADSRDEVVLDRTIGSLVAEPVVYGRDKDEDKIVKCLVEEAANSDVPSVYPILGVGGLGKTTLAQKIFNNDKIKSRFEQRIWICVPEESQQGGANVPEDFDVKALIRSIIFSVSQKKSEANLEGLQEELQKLLKKKRYLLVLDDVWNINEDKWNQLKNTLSCGSKGVSVVITTRLQKAADIMGTFSPHNLSGLNVDDCWLLFKQKAFKNDEEVSPLIEKIAREIVQKCNGVPLVAKTLGGLLRTTRRESKWENVRDTELWKLSEAEKSVLPILRLSYWNLPSYTKQCFAFCAIFPKDYEIDTKLLIRLWRANGFISSSAPSDVEDIGNQICDELASRSLFQVQETDGENISSVKMHDLIHDLAKSVMQDESFIFDGESSIEAEKKIRHMNLHNCPNPASVLDASQKVESLRTLLLNLKGQQLDPIVDVHCFDFLLLHAGCYDFLSDFLSFSKVPRVRAVVAQGLRLEILPPTIGSLIHLRYLDFSCSSIEVLPETICDLWNLKALDLSYCYSLQKLPDQTRRLKNLWDLFLEGCNSLESIPPRLGEMIGLKTFDFFVVGEHKRCGISELKDLNLKGKLHINHLERVRNLEDAQNANMRGKKNLHFLIFSWHHMSSDPCIDLHVLEALEPHPNLEKMEIRGYNDTSLPRWMGNPIYRKLVSIELRKLKSCLRLPSLGKLPSLKLLSLYEVKCIKYIDDVDYGEGATIFPSLEELKIEDSESLEKLLVVEEGDIFPRLTHMNIWKCPKLILSSIGKLPSLKFLELEEVDCIKYIDDVVYGEGATIFPSLEKLEIEDLESLEGLLVVEEGDIFPSLEELAIEDLESLEGLLVVEEGDIFPRFTHMNIRKCPELILSSLGKLPSLKFLELEEVNRIGYIDDVVYGEEATIFPSLEELVIYSSESLERLLVVEEGDIFPRLTRMIIDGCPKLILPRLPSVTTLIATLSDSSLASVSNLRNLTRLEISADSDSTALPNEIFTCLSALQTLEIYHFKELDVLPNSMMNLTALKKFRFYDNRALVDFPPLGGLTSLQELEFVYLSKLSSLPTDIQNNTTLLSLKIIDCPELKKRYKKEDGQDWDKISHIPNVIIRDY